jgi:hypothetical protein
VTTSKQRFRPPIIGVHVDLKGMNFKPAYIPQYLADLASQGVNTVLVEYEDVFPFSGIDVAFDPATRWNGATLRRFLGAARESGIEVIPLQQCLGHLEYVLSWNRYRHLAEDPSIPNTIRLGEPDAIGLVLRMLEQIIAAHPESTYVHLGMDEAHGLEQAAARLHADPLELFLSQLRRALEVVERAGKTAVIWSDMLERHFRRHAFDEFKDRLVVMPWFYTAIADATPLAPLGGPLRVSRSWLRTPNDPAAPPIQPETRFVEDLPPELRQAMAPYTRNRMFKSLAQVELWSNLGLRVIGASALRFTFNGSVLPLYNRQFCNVRGWSQAILAARQLGQIGTSWARATSWSPPNHCIDLQWPIVSEMARSMGARPKSFWPGIPAPTLNRIFSSLGRCREDWRIEGQIADEMEAFEPRLRAHRFEWQSIILMTRLLELHRRADAEIARAETSHADNRPVDSEWQRRIAAIDAILRAFARMRRDVHRHYSQRFHGAAFEEWVRHLFDLRNERLIACRAFCEDRRSDAAQRYARNGSH